MATKLSSREQAAKKKGGTLNYKTGKISVPVKTTKVSSPSVNKNWVAPANFIGPTLTDTQRGYVLPTGSSGPLRPGIDMTQAEYESSSVKNGTSSKSSSSNRAKAATPVSLAPLKNTGNGETISHGTISAAKPTSFLSDLMGKIGQMVSNNSLSRDPGGAFLTAEQRDLNRGQLQSDINSGLGIETANASNLERVLQKESTPDQPTGYGPNGEIYYNNFDPASEGAMMFMSDFATPGTNFSRPGSETAYQQGTSPVDYGMKQRNQDVVYGSQPTTVSRTPRQTVSQPTQTTPQFTPSTSDISNISPEVVSQISSLLSAIQPDNTQVNQGQPGTRRQFLGNGVLSNGAFNNGQGNYGIQGALTGTEGSQMDEQSLLNNLLGIKTAQAADMPQTMDWSMAQNTPVSSFQQSFAQGGLSGANPFGTYQQSQDQINPTNVAPQVQPRIQAPENQGGVAQQFSQGTTGGSPMEKYYKNQEKGYSAQEKAQKRALDELIKSIKSQYSTQTETGTSDLNKAKQEDLLKLSGLFSFANQDPNSEQRIQYEQRANQDYATQLSNFLAKIASAQGQDISQAKQGYHGKIADIAQQRNATALEIAKLQQSQQQADQKGGRTTTPKVTHNDVFNFVNDSISNGATWQEIADAAKAQGVDTSTGSYIDKLLNNSFKQ